MNASMLTLANDTSPLRTQQGPGQQTRRPPQQAGIAVHHSGPGLLRRRTAGGATSQFIQLFCNNCWVLLPAIISKVLCHLPPQPARRCWLYYYLSYYFSIRGQVHCGCNQVLLNSSMSSEPVPSSPMPATWRPSTHLTHHDPPC